MLTKVIEEQCIMYYLNKLFNVVSFISTGFHPINGNPFKKWEDYAYKKCRDYLLSYKNILIIAKHERNIRPPADHLR